MLVLLVVLVVVVMLMLMLPMLLLLLWTRGKREGNGCGLQVEQQQPSSSSRASARQLHRVDVVDRRRKDELPHLLPVLPVLSILPMSSLCHRWPIQSPARLQGRPPRNRASAWLFCGISLAPKVAFC